LFFPLINNTFWLAIVARIELKRQIAIERQTNVRHINKKAMLQLLVDLTHMLEDINEKKKPIKD